MSTLSMGDALTAQREGKKKGGKADSVGRQTSCANRDREHTSLICQWKTRGDRLGEGQTYLYTSKRKNVNGYMESQV